MPEAIGFGDVREAVARLERRLQRVDAEGLRRRLLELGLIVRCSEPAELGVVYAVDTAFPSRPVTLLGFSMSIVAAAAVSSRGGRRIVRRWLLVEDYGELDQDYVTGFARLQERLLALELAEHADTILLDGEIIPRPGRSGVWASVGEATERLLGLVGKATLAGVLKRSYSKTIASRLGLLVSDRVLATAVLHRGEAMITRHGDPRLAELGCVEAFYKPLRGPGAAVKVEACCGRRLDCCGLIARLVAEAGASGFPWMLDLVDSLVKREVQSVAAVEALLARRLAERGAHYAGMAANPQERRDRRRV